MSDSFDNLAEKLAAEHTEMNSGGGGHDNIPSLGDEKRVGSYKKECKCGDKYFSHTN